METGEEREYSISELAEAAGVSTRTIRYYVSEGLLPPPVGSGPNSRYTDLHRRQLGIIGRLKAQYLPLREIRRRLIGHGEVHGVVDSAASPGFHGLSRRAREIAEEHVRMEAVPAAPPPSAPMAEPMLSAALPPPEPDRDRPWRRVAISDEAELLITEDQYRRHQDKIDWLIQWATRVLGS
jgi:DNA-binding transcriptional MerR regulator